MAKAGAPAKFNEAHVNWVFWKIAKSQPAGRKLLVETTGLGEGSIRSILDRLDEYGLVKSSKAGRKLTKDGKNVYRNLKKLITIEEIDESDLNKGNDNVAIIIRGASEKIKTGTEQRDAAIKVGASGITTIICNKGELIIPNFNKGLNITKKFPKASKKLIEVLGPEDGDVIILGSEKTSAKSEEVAWIAASTILES